MDTSDQILKNQINLVCVIVQLFLNLIYYISFIVMILFHPSLSHYLLKLILLAKWFNFLYNYLFNWNIHIRQALLVSKVEKKMLSVPN